MILAVDDEKTILFLIEHALQLDGLEVETFLDVDDALVRAKEVEPELVISDIMMPKLDGFEFKKAFDALYPDCHVPFVFLSSNDSSEDVIRGLDADAADYLTKPIDSGVLRAKIRSLMRRRPKPETAVFHGDLGMFPFPKIIQFCETQGLNGSVEFAGNGVSIDLPFKGGSVDLDTLNNADDVLTQLYDLEDGSFVIRAQAIDFSALDGVQSSPLVEAGSPAGSGNKPMGRLSGIKVNDRLFQVQTEMVERPEPSILTIVILDGKTVHKKAQIPPEGNNRPELQALIEAQHLEAEKEIQAKVDALAEKRAASAQTAKSEYYTLFEAGFDAYRSGDIESALKKWEEAHELNPDDQTLEINLKIARAKLRTA